LRADSATIEVTALAPDLFRVGFFPQGRSVDYSSVAVVSQDWQSGPVTIVEEADEVTLATSAAAAQSRLSPCALGLPITRDAHSLLDDPELGMAGSRRLEKPLLSIWPISLERWNACSSV